MMKLFATRRPLALWISVAALSLLPGVGRAATTVEPGFELFVTDPSTTMFLSGIPNEQAVSFQGVPLNVFDFGSGNINVGDADTIVERTQLANLGGGSDTIDIEIVALSLVSTDPVDLGFGAGFEQLFITLNSSSPSTQSTRTIFDTGEADPHGTFDSTRNFSIDLTGSVAGFYLTVELTTTPSNNPWRHEPGLTVIDDVNHLLNGANESADFWPTAAVFSTEGGFIHVSSVPPPAAPPSVPSLSATSLALVVGLLGLLGWRRAQFPS